MAVPSWAGKMRAAFGGGFLWLVCFIYFTQGFRSFVWTAVSYQLKDIMKLSPSASQFLVSAAFFPWSIKPLYGILSDCIPIKGRKRIPYLLLATMLSLVPWPLLGSSSFLRSSQMCLTVLLVTQNIGSAMADVVIDAMIAEACRAERAAFAGDLQTLSWSAMAFGGVCGSLLGGYTLSHFDISTIFLLFSIFPSIQLLSCAFVHEDLCSSLVEKEGEDNFHRSSAVSDSVHLLNGESKMEAQLANGNGSSDEPTSRGTVKRRKKSKKNGGKKNGKRRSNKEVTLDEKKGKHRSLIMRAFMSLRSAFHSLLRAFRQPAIIRPMAWFFLSHITIPNLSTVMFYYQTEVLHLEASFLGTARVVGWFGLMFGTFTYNRYLKRVPLRRILLWAHIGLAFLNSFDIVLVSRKNVQLGISDKYLVLCGSALSDAVNQFKMMPFLILSGQLCPPGIEGTLFALFMSINNLGSTIGSFHGAALASVLNISSNSFNNLLLGVSLQLVATFVPVFFLFLIPKEATGLSA